jgi:glucokinase
MSEPDFYVGIDLGGTMVRAGTVDARGTLLAVNQTPIQAADGPRAGLQRITTLVEKTVGMSPPGRLRGIGIGATGPIDHARGIIQNPYTLPTWENVPITEPLAQHFGVPALLENDADAAALGEYWAGAGQGARRLYAVTVGTGIGTAFVLEGHIYRGLDDFHPEGGHILLDPSGPECYCGLHGCWESLAAGPAIASFARQRAAAEPSTLLWQLAGSQPERIDAALVAEAARLDDPLACALIEQTARYLGLGLLNIIHFFLPDVIILSGGVMQSAGLFLPSIQRLIAAHSLMVPASGVRIVPACLGYHAGLVGAACAIHQWTEENST